MKNTPSKRRCVDKDSINIEVPQSSSRRIIRTATRRSSPVRSPPTERLKEEHNISDQPKAVPSKHYHLTRKCKLCGEPLKNLGTHLCEVHLGRTWWGIIGDQTRWVCQKFHKPSDISKCSGSYVPLFHKDLLISRHVDFINSLMEDF